MTSLIDARGRVLHADTPATLHSQVWPGIHVGGSFDSYGDTLSVDIAVLACPEREVAWCDGATATEHHCLPLHDGPLLRTTRQRLLGPADYLAEQLAAGRTIAFRCYLGLNRSALLAALTWHAYTGTPGPQLVADVRAARGPDALCNPAFAAYLESLT